MSLPFGLMSKPLCPKTLSLASLLFASSLWASPSKIDDEAFLLFLADSIEKDGQLIDPLSMIQQDENHSVDSHTSQQKEADYEE